MVKEKIGYKICNVEGGRLYSYQRRILPAELVVEYKFGEVSVPPNKKMPLFLYKTIEDGRMGYYPTPSYKLFKVSYVPSRYRPAKDVPKEYKHLVDWGIPVRTCYADSLTIIEEVKEDAE